jgi:hypothetical protein
LANSTLAIFYQLEQAAPWRARQKFAKKLVAFRRKAIGKKWQGGHFLPPFRPSVTLIPLARD